MPSAISTDTQTTPAVRVSLSLQRLWLLDGDTVVADYPVSTAANGAGEANGSMCTPRGRHVIRARIGDGCPAGTVFVGRRPTGEIYAEGMREREPERDWILTRILWLSGCEPGRNRLGEVDTMRRYIYIHGTPDEVALGVPGSHGCIRMANTDVIELFERVPVGTPVQIEE
jgi:lipoprotein-anchoring transpeptidase ErfK/SrfK